MRQLSALDRLFLTRENPRTPAHLSALLFYSQQTAPGGRVRLRDIVNVFAERAHAVPFLHCRVQEVPFGLDNPYWVHDKHFNVESHVNHVALPKPGDWRQLCIMAARIHARPVDRSRPLWEATVIEGLDNIDFLPRGSFAILLKVHHAAVDGIEALKAVERLHDTAPAAVHEDAGDARGEEGELPAGEMLARAGLHALGTPLRWGRLAGNLLPAVARVVAAVRGQRGARAAGAVNTRFSGRVSSYRVVESTFFALAELKAIRAAVPHSTLNDVLVTVIGGAMRRYFQSRGPLQEPGVVRNRMAPRLGAAARLEKRAEAKALRRLDSVKLIARLRHDDAAVIDQLQRLSHRKPGHDAGGTCPPTRGPDARESVTGRCRRAGVVQGGETSIDQARETKGHRVVHQNHSLPIRFVPREPLEPGANRVLSFAALRDCSRSLARAVPDKSGLRRDPHLVRVARPDGTTSTIRSTRGCGGEALERMRRRRFPEKWNQSLRSLPPQPFPTTSRERRRRHPVIERLLPLRGGEFRPISSASATERAPSSSTPSPRESEIPRVRPGKKAPACSRDVPSPESYAPDARSGGSHRPDRPPQSRRGRRGAECPSRSTRPRGVHPDPPPVQRLANRPRCSRRHRAGPDRAGSASREQRAGSPAGVDRNRSRPAGVRVLRLNDKRLDLEQKRARPLDRGRDHRSDRPGGVLAEKDPARICDLDETPAGPISKTPSSSTPPNRFFTLRRIR